MSAIDKAALMDLIEGEYDPNIFDKIMGRAYRIEYYREEVRQCKTDVR